MPRDWAESDFVRIYHSIKTDEKLRAVYRDDELLAWYVRLLMEAHSAYPTPAYIPRGIGDVALDKLVELGVVSIEGDFFVVNGLVKERAEVTGRQGGMIRAATAERDDSGRFTRAGYEMPTIEEADGRADIEAFVELRGKAPTPRQRQALDDILSRHDVTGPQWAADIMRTNPQDPLGAVFAADKEWRAQRKTAAIREERHSAENKRRPGFRDPLLQEMAKVYAERELTA